SGTVTEISRAYINDEFSQLSQEVDSIASGTAYSGQSLLDSTSAFASGVSGLVGAGSSDTIAVTIASLTTSALSIPGLDVSSHTGAASALNSLSSAHDTVAA